MKLSKTMKTCLVGMLAPDATSFVAQKNERTYAALNSCGALQDKMPLNVRTWACSCGTTHDRDHNAALNVLAAGQAERLNACGDQVRPAPGLAQVSEAGTHPQRTTHLAWEQTGIPGL